jgi:plastocyanin
VGTVRLPLIHLAVIGSFAVTGLVGTTVAASATDGSQAPTQRIRMQDDCDRRTFNAVLGAGSCVGDGGTTFDELFEQLTERRQAGAWNFSPNRVTVDAGTGLRAFNEGGETHSFTRVRRFGPGCVPEINQALGFRTGAFARECATPAWLRTLRRPGTAIRVRGLQTGTHRFACLIHPWMRTTVQVRAADD